MAREVAVVVVLDDARDGRHAVAAGVGGRAADRVGVALAADRHPHRVLEVLARVVGHERRELDPLVAVAHEGELADGQAVRVPRGEDRREDRGEIDVAAVEGGVDLVLAGHADLGLGSSERGVELALGV
jgi:hypothetical protein